MAEIQKDGFAVRLAVIIVVLLGVLSIGYFRGGGDDDGAETASDTLPDGPTAEWHKGGTLHNESALEWQTATAKNKLATCADFLTRMWQNGKLAPMVEDELTTINDAYPFARQLVTELDSVFEARPDPEDNRRAFTGQAVSEGIMSVMDAKGWLKTDES